MNPGYVAALRKRAAEQGGGWGIPSGGGKGPPQPIGTLQEKLKLASSTAAIPGRYVLTMEPNARADAFTSAARRAQARVWAVLLRRHGHPTHVTTPRLAERR